VTTEAEEVIRWLDSEPGQIWWRVHFSEIVVSHQQLVLGSMFKIKDNVTDAGPPECWFPPAVTWRQAVLARPGDARCARFYLDNPMAAEHCCIWVNMRSVSGERLRDGHHHHGAAGLDPAPVQR
jgi:hypothetical protein